MQNKGLILIAAIIAFIVWLLSRKKGGGGAMTFPEAPTKLPTDKPMIGGGGSFGGGGASGSWLTETATTINPAPPKPSTAIASPLQLVDKAAITEKVLYSKPIIDPITPAPSVVSPSLVAIKEAFKPQVMPVTPIAMSQNPVAPAPVVPVSPVIPKPVLPSVVVPAVPVIAKPVVPAPVITSVNAPIVTRPAVQAPMSPITNPNSPLLFGAVLPREVSNTIVTGVNKPIALL